MTVPEIVAVELSNPGEGAPLLVLGPSLGTSAETLWTASARMLGGNFRIVGWDLPGHGRSPAVTEPFSMAELGAGVLAVVDSLVGPEGSFRYAGDSIGGCVGLQLLLEAPTRVTSAALLCTGARIGTRDSWTQRAEQVRRSGTPSLVASSAERWFAPGFIEKNQAAATALLEVLHNADADSYARACEALGAFDVRERLGGIDAPVLVVGGAEDVATPPEQQQEIADGVRRGAVTILDGVAHLAPVEAPQTLAGLLRRHFLEGPVTGEPARQTVGPGHGARDGGRTLDEVYASGMAVRRAVLGAAHVDRANDGVTDFTADFQTMITRYAWDGIWARPGLDRRTRSFITLTAMVALGHHDEFAMHVRAARTNGLTNDEIREVLLQCAIYCGVPAANTAFKIAQGVLDELDG